MTTDPAPTDFRAVFEQFPAGIVIYSPDLRIVECNEGFASLIQSSREQIIGLGIEELRDQRHRFAVTQALAGQTVSFASPYQATTSDAWPWLHATFAPLRSEKGGVVGVIVMASDHSPQVRAAVSGPTLQAQLAETQRLGQIGSWTWDAERGIAAASPEFYRILGLNADWMSAPPSDFQWLILPEDRPACLARLADMLAHRSTNVDHEFRIHRVDETIRWINLRAHAAYGSDGRLLSAWGLIQDVTEQRLLQEQLRQSQKMEAMGQLAAGIAHDFNNLLTVIRLESEFLADELEVRDGVRVAANGIQTATDRAAGLTRQLLAFSRRQVLRPQLLDVNDTVASASQMLERLIGEDIELVTDLSHRLPHILADAGQLVQVLVNLTVNARDAMPKGGTLSMTTGMVVIGDEQREPPFAPGEYVVIVVTDTGHGMDDATRRRIFEPFFTTKAPGTGTGLGLSTVYGIMQQSAAQITVASEVDKGATFTLYFLPQLADTESARGSRRASQTRLAPASTATVLLAEDEVAVRATCRRTLEREGHTVLVAEDGNDALRVADAHPGNIDLLVTDIVLPGLNGREVYDHLRLSRPGVRVLYMSGYTDDALARRGLIDRSASLLEKPFATADLVAAVRKELARS